MVVSPTPNANYSYTAYIRSYPVALSGSNTTTELSVDYQEMLFYACLHQAALFKKHDEGLQRWETEYQKAKEYTLQESVGIYANEYGRGMR